MTTQNQRPQTRFGRALLEESQAETPAQRVLRLYKGPAGPLAAWLLDDAKLRRHNAVVLAHELGVSNEELRLLERGEAPELLLNRAFLAKASGYLAIPPIAARLLTGDIRVRDFATRVESEEQIVEREFARFMANPTMRDLVSDDDKELTTAYKRFLLDVHATHRELDWPDLPRLPEILRWLQRAAIMHDGNEGEAAQADA